MKQTRTPRKSQKPQSVTTLKDVADAAGVSIASASRAINNLSNVKEAVRERIMAVAARLNYHPNLGARSLALSRTNTIAFLMPDVSGEFAADLIRGVDEAARRAGIHLLISGGANSVEKTGIAVQSLTGRADGFLILTPDGDSAALAKLLPAGTIYVSFTGVAAFDSQTCLVTDHFDGGRVATRHLIFNGCRRIIHLGGDENAFEAMERARGYAVVMDSLGLEAKVTMDIRSEAEGERAVSDLLAVDDAPDGIFASTDIIAIGAIKALKAAGLRVPEDVAVIGYGDVVSADGDTPAISSMGFDAYQISGQVFQALLFKLAPYGECIPEVVGSTPRPIERGSSMRRPAFRRVD